MKKPTATFPLDNIRDGRRVTVTFVQSGLTICVMAGRFVPPPPDAPRGRRVYMVLPASLTTYVPSALILDTDRVTWFAASSTIRVDLRGPRVKLPRKTRRQA